VTFDESGIVVLGCNIHDHMLAYILVVDTPAFAKTDDRGVATLDAQVVGDMTVSIWSPRIRDDLDDLSVAIEPGEIEATLTFNLVKPLRAPHHEESGALSWNDY
jgi:hypothetical protein